MEETVAWETVVERDSQCIAEEEWNQSNKNPMDKSVAMSQELSFEEK